MVSSVNLIQQLGYTLLSIKFENNCNFSTDTGNENVVRNVKIKGDYLREVDDTGKLGQALTFYFQSHEDCRAECASRYGIRPLK